ncbi:MAG: dihydrofolate reductase [Bacteroidales bacterium]|nr:dihydrofolate reductase [Bacteroidales bacterium]
MKYLKFMFLTFTLSFAATSCVTQKNGKEEFRYLADEFADLRVIRYKIPGWENLSFNQKEYIYHLSEAAKAGRDIFWDQNFKHGLKVRKVLEKIFENYNGEKESQDYKEFEIYAKRVFFSNGIHHHYAEDKFTPGCSQEYFGQLLTQSGQEEISSDIHPIIYDPNLYPQRKNISGKGDLLLGSSVNFYENVTREEAEKFYAKMEDPSDVTPVSYGLNSRLVKTNGTISEEVYKIDGLYGPAIKQIIFHLENALKCAENDTQKEYISLLTQYYKTGNLKTWDKYNVAWVKDTSSQVDFINGFIETYNDPLGMKATWESVVNFKDIEASKRTDIISSNAQWFEDNSPINPEFKKKEVKGVSAKVITVAQLGGDCHPTSPLGINLPNADWIRKEHGSKSVTIANISEAYDMASQEAPKSMTTEFSWDQAEIDLLKKYGTLTNNIHTDLHECLGHGSGQLKEGTSPNALKEFSSPLEEARADIFALYYMADPKLVDLGILPDSEAYKASYLSYIRNGIFTQFVRIDLGKNVTQAHMQARKLISEWCYENGQKDNVIEKKEKDGKTYFVINDYTKLRRLFGELLKELQRVKSQGDYNAGKDLIETYAVDIDQDLHKELKERYASLDLKPYGGFINPDIIPVTENGRITDYKVEYPSDFLQQMLDYGKKYSFL